MGIGGFLASHSGWDKYRYQWRNATRSRSGLRPGGCGKKICSSVAKYLLDFELESEGQGYDSLTAEDGGLK